MDERPAAVDVPDRTLHGDDGLESDELYGGPEFNWIDEDDPEPEEYQIEEYDIVSSPNDFNISTIFNFVESGAVRIPGFQRHYVWDIKRASKLIESLVLGLPVPQIFLYEDGRNSFQVIDGQQRLMSIYYFIKHRFPRKEKRAEIRRVFAERGSITDDILQDDRYFVKFDLVLPNFPSGRENRFSGMNYSTMGDSRRAFDLRTIRNVIVKQVSPREDDSSIYEIFNRLNTGGVNLTPQEIRASLYHSPFYDMLARINLEPGWRRFLNLPDPDVHMKDEEVLLRSFAILLEEAEYAGPMVRFLDRFSKGAKSFSVEKVKMLEDLFESFVIAAATLSANAFQGDSGKFNTAVFESVFAAICRDAMDRKQLVTGNIDPVRLMNLRRDRGFIEAASVATTNKGNVQARLKRSRAILLPPREPFTTVV